MLIKTVNIFLGDGTAYFHLPFSLLSQFWSLFTGQLLTADFGLLLFTRYLLSSLIYQTQNYMIGVILDWKHWSRDTWREFIIIQRGW